MMIKIVLSKIVFILLLVIPIFFLLYTLFYEWLRVKSYYLDDRIFDFFLITVPISAIYFLSKKGLYYKIYGGLISIYIVYSVRAFLIATSGAM